MLLLVVVVLAVHRAGALIGYDCGGPSLNITTISLTEIGACNIPQVEPIPVSTNIQLLQLSEFSNTEVVQCKIEIDRIIYYCGMSSHNSIVHNGRQIYLHEVDERSCRRIHESGILQLSTSGQLVGLKRNSTTTRSITLAGSVTNEGKCSGTQYSDPFGTWDNVVVQASVRVTLTTYEASVNLELGKIILESGTHCQVSDGTCLDVEGNSVFWITEPKDTCEFSRYDVLYEGQATKQVSFDTYHRPEIFSLTTQDTTFALAAKTEKHICGYTLIKTEHPKLYILETKSGHTFAKRGRIPVNNLDIFTYMNSKFVYVEKHIAGQIKGLYKDILKQRCKLEQQVLQNALSTAGILPEKFARAIMKTPGYMAVIAGEVAHIIKCTPVECLLRKTMECYNELPVTHKNQSYFLNTISKVLVKSGTQIDCDPLLPAQYFIDGNWYRFTPYPVVVSSPQILQPNSAPTWGYNPIGNLATSGIYSSEEINRLRDRIMFPAEKPALLNNIARGSVGFTVPSGSVSLRNLLDEDTINHLAESTFKRFWGGFEKFGTFSAGVIAIITIFTIIKAVVDTCIHGFTLHSIYGWSFALLGAVWNSVTSLLVTRAYNKEKATRDPALENNEQLQEIITVARNRPSEESTPNPRNSGVDPELLSRLVAGLAQNSIVAQD